MNKNLMMAVILGSSMVFLGACGSNESKDESMTETPVEQLEVTVDYDHAYVCPMACENSASNEAGQCPVCGMDLKPNPNYKGATETTPAEGDGGTMKEESHAGHDHEGHSH